MLKVSDKPLLTLLEAGGVNDMPVIMPVAAPNDALIEAIKTVRAAGYRVSKPRKPKIFKRGKDRVGPTFVAEFADDVITRMSTFTSLEKLDWGRGERLSQAVINHGGGHANAPIISNKPVSPAWSRRGGVDRARGS